ncbi:MAG TPA: hypothetical protein VGC69_05815 [Bordetella sp.]
MMSEPRCADCRHRQPDAGHVEKAVPGLTAFGSGYGASIGASRLCLLHDCLVSPDDRCNAHAPWPADKLGKVPQAA